MTANIFQGCVPALLTPCRADRSPDFDTMARKAKELISLGMSGVVYCGSMGDWPLLTDEQRMAGVERLVGAGVPVVVGTGAQNTARSVAIAAHAKKVGAKGLMIIPRVLSRGVSTAAQQAHFSRVLESGVDLPSVIYNSPYYGFQTRAELFFALRARYPHLVGFKEFGGAESLSYAAENITGSDPTLSLVVGVDTQVFHGYVNCCAAGTITGIGNVLPREVLHLVSLCRRAAAGDPVARRRARELDRAINVLSTFDEGPDLVLYFKHMMVTMGSPEYTHHFDPTDKLSEAQRSFCESQLRQFNAWYAKWAPDNA